MDTFIFKVGKDNWDLLSLRKIDNPQTLMFEVNGSVKNVIFKLTDNPRTNSYCQWSFFLSSKTGLYTPRPIFYKQDVTNGNNTQIGITNAKSSLNKTKVIIDLDEGDTTSNFWEMISYFRKFKRLVDLGMFEEKLSLEEISNSIDSLEKNEKSELLLKISDNYTLNELENILNRTKVKSVEQFAMNLNNEKFLEPNWQEFFRDNKWMLSTVSTKLIFQDGDENKIVREATQGTTDNQNHSSPRTDFVAYNTTCTFIELKRPQTPIFSSTNGKTGRTNTRSFSKDFIDGVSQCLGQINSNEQKSAYDNTNTKIDYINQCPKSIFIIGNLKKELDSFDDKERDKCRKSFEAFRHNSKNVEIITYDELYERVHYIVNQFNS